MRLLSHLLLAAIVFVGLVSASFAATPSTPAKTAGPVVLLQTTQGPILIKLFPKDAPVTCANFLKLVKTGFYNGLYFHRVMGLNPDEPGGAHMAQGGDPNTRHLTKDQVINAPEGQLGMGGSGQNIKGEFIQNGVNNPLKLVTGAIAMARSQDPNSASSQFFICQTPVHFLDGQYAVFGIVIKGLDNAAKIQVGDRITKATVVSAS